MKKSNLEFFSRYLNLSQRFFIYSDFDSAHLLTVTGLQFLDSPHHEKFRSVENFKLSCMVSELKAIIFIYF